MSLLFSSGIGVVRKATTFAIVSLVFVTPSAFAINYTATLLHPVGFDSSSATGVSVGLQAGAGHVAGSQTSHALLWTGTAASAVDLNPNGYRDSFATSSSGVYQAGYGFSVDHYSALLWSGTAQSAIDLNPTGYAESEVYGISGAYQVGEAITPSPRKSHAFLWNGTADSGIDLHPASGYFNSQANGVSGGIQVGHAFVNFAGTEHALLWTGSAASVVDLNGTYLGSDALAVSGDTEVGSGNVATGFQSAATHASLWHGAATSAVDLNPQGFASSQADAISSAGQVGYGKTSGSGLNHALYWNGTATSALDLHSYLSGLGQTFSQSEALSIDDDGTIVGRAYDDAMASYFAVMWTPQFTPGDFNHDGKVDAQDYITWRNGLGTQYSVGDYDVWRTHFGQNSSSSGASAANSTIVPEPSAILLFAAASVCCLHRRRRRPNSHDRV